MSSKTTKPADTEARASGVMRAERPRPRLSVDRVAYHLLSPRGPADPTLLSAYATWRDGWRATLRELDGVTEIPSDEFTRLDQVGVLMSEGRCISVTGMRWLDLSLPMWLHDSYFRAWPTHVVESLGSGLLGISCNTIVAADWRGTLVHPEVGDPVSLKDLTIRMSLRRFLGSSARIFVGVARNDRGMHRVAGDLGSRRMARIVLHGVESDICGWARSDVADLGPVVESLWGRMSSTPA
jgi:hypothetical protein